MTENNDFVGFKCTMDGNGCQSVSREEADEIVRLCDEADVKRKNDMPTERDAINAMQQAYIRLRDFGWREAIYCPKDGRTFKVIENGSTGIHDCHYEGKWPKGTWWVHSEGDLWPSRPCLFKPTETVEAALSAVKEE